MDPLAWMAASGIAIKNPLTIVVAIPVILIILIILKKPWVEARDDEDQQRKRRKTRMTMIITRSIIVLLFAIALATPVRVEERTIQTDPFINILVDNSSSMAMFDTSGISSMVEKLGGKVVVRTASIADGERSALGDSILARVRKGDNVLLVSDGQTTHGASLGDVSLFAASNNITLSALKLPLRKPDAWVIVEGAAKTTAGTDAQLEIKVGTSGLDKVPLKVTIDDEIVLETESGSMTHTIIKTLPEGLHKVEARIETTDAFESNNVYYKTIRAVPRPKLIYWGKSNAPLLNLLKQVYEVQNTDYLPDDLDPYYAVVMDDIPDSEISLSDSSMLNKFVTDGGGLFVVGGQQSYERGGYASSSIKNLLPVTIGQPGKDVGDVNVMIIMDASQSSSDTEGAGLAVARRLATGIINDMDPKVKIGLIVFRHEAELISPLIRKSQTADLQEKISRIFGAGGSNMADAIRMGIEELGRAQGSKNMVIISDGLLLDQVAEESRFLAQQAFQKGIKVYTIGAAVGDEDFIQERLDEDLLKDVAENARGIYFRANTASRLKLLFNPPKDAPERNETDRQASVLDSNHYITDDLVMHDASITGYNSVIPKTSAKLLVTLNSGEPLLTVWRLGLGRVVSLATDGGQAWSGPLLSANNSKLLIRTTNWAVGDPDRKSANRVDVPDGRLGEPIEITVNSDSPPTSREVALSRTGQTEYKGSITPEKTGFIDVLNTQAAVNAPREYERAGESPALAMAVTATGGKRFGPNDIDAMAELAKTKSMETVKQEFPLRWVVMLAVFFVWIIELTIRRILGMS